MKNLFIWVLFVCGFASMSTAVAEQQQCEDSTTLTITLPEDVEKEPTVSPDRLCVKKNGKIDVSLVATGDKPKAMILFSGTTPLVTSKGAKEYSAKISKNGKPMATPSTASR